LISPSEDILNQLLDKYEKSKHYKAGESKSRVKIDFLKYCNKFIYEKQEEYFAAVKLLKEKDLVDCDWVKGQDNRINNVWLNVENVNAAYVYINRESKLDFVKVRLNIIESALKSVNMPWIREYLEDVIGSTNCGKDAKDIMKKEIEYIDGVIKALKRIDSLKAPEFIRGFSVACYDNSKTFEKEYQSKIISVARKYEPTLKNIEKEDITDNEVLAQLGIIAKPEIFECCGNCIIRTSVGSCDVSVFKKGFSLNSYFVNDITEIKMNGVDKIIFIENRTNYYDYMLKKKANEFIIYHGGFYSPAKGKLFANLVANAEDIDKFFWGDIDMGGFKMFCRLKNNIVNDLKPLKMDVSNYYKYLDYGIEKSTKYLDDLKKLLDNEEFCCFTGVIEAIISEKKVVEQESFLV
jgi:hypothetical protein